MLITGYGLSIFHLATPIKPDSILLKFFFMLFEAAEMSDKKRFRFRLTSQKAENYFTWSHDMEVVLSGCGL